MKCTKIKLSRREAIIKKHKEKATEHYGYFFKLEPSVVKSMEHSNLQKEAEPQLTVITMLFPENTYFNTGSSMERWSKKTPRLMSAKSKNYAPRKNMLDDEYDLPYVISEFLDNNTNEIIKQEMENFDEEDYVSTDIEELIIKSEILTKETDKKQTRFKKNEKETAKKKRNKFKKTIKFSFSKPASPETEQVIRIDVTTNVSVVDFECNNLLLLKNDCSKGHGKMIISKQQKSDDDDNNNNNNNEQFKKEIDKDINDGVKEDSFVKCRQLALTQKKL